MGTNDVRRMAAGAGDHPVVENAARLGYAVSGVLHLLIGWLGIQVAWFGGSGGAADQSGALQKLAGSDMGRVVLWLSVAGFLGLTLWQLIEVVVGRGRTSDRLKAAGKAVVYLALCLSALSYARTGSGSSGSRQSVDVTASLLGRPAGKLIVGAVGLAVVAVGGYHVYKGWRKRFVDDLRRYPGQWAVRAGVFGYVAKGIALGVVGALFVVAAVRSRPEEATGLDGALRTLAAAPLGTVLLSLVAVGFASFAMYSFARARYARV